VFYASIAAVCRFGSRGRCGTLSHSSFLLMRDCPLLSQLFPACFQSTAF
jgi:hypothetical protein